MRRLAAILTACALALTCVGCSPDTPVNKRFGLAGTASNAYIITDNATGVQYLMIRAGWGVGVTPLLSADGLPLMVDDLNHGDMETALRAARANLGVDG